MSDMIQAKVLTTDERRSLDACEASIARGIEHFYTAGKALATIREDRLYRESYEGFEEYCRERWNFGRGWADRMIRHAMTTDAEQLPLSSKVAVTEALKTAANPPRMVMEKARELTGKAVPDLSAEDIRAADFALTDDDIPTDDPPSVEISVMGQRRNRWVTLNSDLRNHARSIVGIRDEIVRIARENTPEGHIGWLNAEHSKRQFDTLAAMVRQMAPYAFCGICGGDGCPSCAHAGWVPQHVFDQLHDDEKGTPL